ncbi:PKD domain-containing protein [Methanoculleus sp. 7T]|nr:PKD domain-containing protein [Methanoculleus sp. 7T]
MAAGIIGTYYPTIDFTGTSVQRTDRRIWFADNDANTKPYIRAGTDEYDWPQSTLGKQDRFSVIYEGYLLVPADDTYTFYLTSDDGSWLWLDAIGESETPLIDNGGYHSVQEKTASVSLAAGAYPIRAKMFENNGEAVFHLEWSSSAFGRTPINSFCQGPGTAVEANFTASATSGTAPLTVGFTDLSTGDVTSWYWDFGDGAFSTEQNPAHMYNTTGTFNVNLTVADDTGASDSLEIPDYINVSEAPPVIVPVISFEPLNTSVDVGGTAEYALILNMAPDGLAGYTLNVDAGAEGVAEIVNVTYPDWAVPTNTSALPDTIVEIKAGDMMDNISAGATNVSLANIMVRGIMEGQTNLSVEVVRMTADGGGPIMPDMMTASLNVTPTAPPPAFPGYENPPRDPNNDGWYEDINGNGEIEYDDVVALNTNMQWIEENNLVPLFDFNNNGKIDYDDVVMLFDMI